MEVTQQAPAFTTKAPLKPYVDIVTGDSYATRTELDQAKAARQQLAAARPPRPATSEAGQDGTKGVGGEQAAAAAASSSAGGATSTDDEPAPATPTDDAQQTAMLLRSKPSGAVDEPLLCPRCRAFTCSFEANLEGHLRQCRRRELPSHFEVVFPPTSLFPTAEQLREAQKLPPSNEGLSTVVKASRVIQNTVAAHPTFAGPSQMPAPSRRGRPPKDSNLPVVPRGGKLTVTSPSGLVFAMGRDPRSKRFKCPRCITFSHGNPINFHEHVQNECRSPWPSSVPAAAEPRAPVRSRKNVAARAAAPTMAKSLVLTQSSTNVEASIDMAEDEDEDEDLSDEEEDLEDQSVIGEAESLGATPLVAKKEPTLAQAAVPVTATPTTDAGSLIDTPAASITPPPATAPAEGPKPSGPAGALAMGSAAVAPTFAAVAVDASAEPALASIVEGAVPTTQRGTVPRSASSRSLRTKPVKVLKDWGSDDEDMFLASGGDDSEEDTEHMPSGSNKRKKRASTAASDGQRPGQHVLQEGEQSSWQVTCRICTPALAFTNQSVKKVHHRVYHQTVCTIGAVEPGHTIKVVRAGDDTFVCPKCEIFANRDPVSLQTHAKNCKAVYTGPTEPPAPPAGEGGSSSSSKKRSRKSISRDSLPITFDADGNPVIPPESTSVMPAYSRPPAIDGTPGGKIWQCNRCDPPLMLKSESDRAMHYRKTHQMETSITDPAGQVHIIRRSDDGFFRCLRCPGYTSRDSVLARTHIIKSCRYPWPVTPGMVDPNTVEVPSAASSPRETKRRRKSLLGPSGLGMPPGDSEGAIGGSEAQIDPMSYAVAGPSTYAAFGTPVETYPQASFGHHQQADYASAAAAHDPYHQAAYHTASHAAYSHEIPYSLPEGNAGYSAAPSASYGGVPPPQGFPQPAAGGYPYAAEAYAPAALSTEGPQLPPAETGTESYGQPPTTLVDAHQSGFAGQDQQLEAAPDGLQALPSQEQLAFVQLLQENQSRNQTLSE